jgi:hypothetical protein
LLLSSSHKQSVFSADQAVEALLPYRHGNITLTSVPVVQDTVTLLEAMLKYAHDNQTVRILP